MKPFKSSNFVDAYLTRFVQCVTSIRLDQERFINLLEGIGDILVVETKNRKSNQYIIDGLRQIQNHTQAFFNLQQTQPERFPKLLYSPELLQLQKANQLEASARLSFFPKDYLATLMAATNQFLRLREAALEIQNLEIARLATYNLIWLLNHLSQSNGHLESIETLLRVLADIRHANRDKQDDLAYTLAISWYINPVFDKAFQFNFLVRFDHYFIPCYREIISRNKSQLFHGLVSAVYDSGQIKSYSEFTTEDLQSYLMQLGWQSYNEAAQTEHLTQKIDQLKSLERQIKTLSQLEKYLNQLNEIKAVVCRHFDSTNYQKIQEQIEEISCDLKSIFKLNHLIDLMFDLGAYCVFKQRFEYIYILWTFKQPDDADASWIGHDIVPSSLPGLFNFYFQTYLTERISSIFWEDHHGSSRYYNQYFLMLVLREFLNSRIITNQARQNLISSFQLPTIITPHHLSGLEFEVNRLIPLAQSLNKLTDPLQIMGFDITQLNDAIEHGIIPWLESLKPKADEQLDQNTRRQRISQAKVEEFRAEFLKGYAERAKLRQLFRFLELYEDKTHEVGSDNILQFGLSEIHEKPAFFEDWHIDYGHLGLNYGQHFASNEDSQILTAIAQFCRVSENTSLTSVLNTGLFHSN